MKIKLRPYQEDIVTQTINSNKHTLIQVPTGGGKTVISRFIAFDLAYKKDKQVLFVAPKLVLMEQTLMAFKDINPQKVHGTDNYNINHKVLVSTLQTASRREELQPDVIIIDEIHHGYDGSMIENLIKNKPNTRIIGLSATPYDRKGKLLKGFDLILDKYDMNYMIKHNFLVGLKSYVLVRQDLSEVKITAGDYNLGELSQVVCNKNTISEIIETTKKFILESKKTIVFAVDIAHAELLTKAYVVEGFKAKALHSKIKKDEIQKEIELFRNGQTQVLVSVLMLTTGFDVPDTDCGIIARPTKSQNLYKQMVGRVLRIAPNKTSAILLDCGNVIDNLGMPLEPIFEINKNDIKNNNGKQKCENCSAEDLKLIKKDNKLYWECQNKKCMYQKKIKQGVYECDSCHLMHSYKSNFIFDDNKIFLDCSCGNKTLISEYEQKEVFFEVDTVEETFWIKNILEWSIEYNLTIHSLSNKKMLNLKELHLLDKNLYSIPNEIGNFINLKKLYASNNKLERLPKEIGNLKELKKLWLSDNNLIELPKEIINLQNLRELWLYNNSNLVLNEEQKEWLKELKHKKCKIHLDSNIDVRTKDEEWIRKLEKWAKINNIDFFIPINKDMIDLKKIYGGDKKLNQIPKEIGNLKNLKQLYLYDNHLKELPLEITNLKNLKEIMLNNNPDLMLSEKQKEWLAELKKNKCKVSIDIKIDYSMYNKVQLAEKSKKIGFKKKSDKELFLEKVKKWNTKNSNIFCIKELVIIDEKLEVIPKEIELFRELEKLTLSGNNIKELANEISSLPTLKRLYLDRNKLTEIPIIISKLTNLEELWLNYNKLESLPNEIVNLKKLKRIMLNNNSKDFFFTQEQKEWLIELMDNGCLLGIQSKVYRKLLKEKEEIQKREEFELNSNDSNMVTHLHNNLHEGKMSKDETINNLEVNLNNLELMLNDSSPMTHLKDTKTDIIYDNYDEEKTSKDETINNLEVNLNNLELMLNDSSSMTHLKDTKIDIIYDNYDEEKTSKDETILNKFFKWMRKIN